MAFVPPRVRKNRTGTPGPAPESQSAAIAASTLFAAGAAVVLLLFRHVLAGQFAAWETDEYSHNFLLLFLIAAWAIGRLKQNPPACAPSLSGLAVVATAILLKWAGDLMVNSWVPRFAFVVALGGLVVFVAGWRVLNLLKVPYGLLFLTIPLPPTLQASLTAELQLLSSQFGAFGLQILGVPVFQEGNIIDLGRIKLEAAEACSGLRYLFPLLSIGYLLAFLRHRILWERLAVMAATVPITILMNAARIVLIGYVVDMGILGILDESVHWIQGMAVFLLSVALVALISSLLRRRRAESFALYGVRTEGRCFASRRAPAAAASAALVVLCGLGLWTQSAVLGESRPEAAPPRANLADWPMQSGPWTGRRDRLSAAELKGLELDDYLLAQYSRPSGTSDLGLYIAYYASQRHGASTHSPLVCLPGSGWKLEQVEPLTLPQVPDRDGPLTVNRAIIAKGETRMLVYFWYREQGRYMTSTSTIKWQMLKHQLSDRRSDGALLRLTTMISDPGRIAEADAELTAFLARNIRLIPRYVP